MGELSVAVAKGVIASESSRFQAALTSDPASGRIAPIGWEPWYAAAIAECERQPKLLDACQAAPQTVIECLTVAANCGLMVGSAHGQFYLIPRWSGRRRQMEATFIIGYKGLSLMAQRHPRVHKCEGFVVYEGENFRWSPGSGKLEHDWDPGVDRSDENIVAAYSRVILSVQDGTNVLDPEPLVWAMTRDELLAARDRSEGWKAFTKGSIKSTPWQTDFAAMCRKTPMRRHLSNGSVPHSEAMIMALSADTAEEVRLSSDTGPLVSPTASASSNVRGALGIEPGIPEFEFVEEALAFVANADADTLNALAGREGHPKTATWAADSADASTLQGAIEIRRAELADSSPGDEQSND